MLDYWEITLKLAQNEPREDIVFALEKMMELPANTPDRDQVIRWFCDAIKLIDCLNSIGQL